jgi:PKD repeat protein
VLYSVDFDTGETKAYDAASNAWVTLAPPPVGYYGHQAAVVGKSIYASGSYSISTAALNIFTPGFAGNHPPTVVMGGPYAGAEGSAIQFDASATTDPDGDDVGYSWDFGDGSGSTDAAPQHTYTSYGRRTVTLDVADDHDKHTVVTQVVNVANVAPALTLPQHDTIFVNNSYYAQLSFTDPGANTWSATVDYGAGGGTNPLLLSGKSFVLTSPYPHGAYKITVKVNDGRATTTATSTVHVLGKVGALDYVLAKIAALGVSQSVKDSLAASLKKAKNQLVHGNGPAAHSWVIAFDSAVTTQLNAAAIDQETADQLHAYALALAAAI